MEYERERLSSHGYISLFRKRVTEEIRGFKTAIDYPAETGGLSSWTLNLLDKVRKKEKKLPDRLHLRARNVNELPPLVEYRGTRAIEVKDIPYIKNIYRHQPTAAHLEMENVPTGWGDLNQVEIFEKHLVKFYFPEGLLKVSNIIDGGYTEARRHTIVAVDSRDRAIGTVSYLDADPYAPRSDKERVKNGKLRIAYLHALAVAPHARGQGVSLHLMSDLCDEVFSSKYNPPFNQISDWVNLIGAYNVNIDLMHRVGFKEDRRQRGQMVYNPAVGVERRMRSWRFILTRNDWEDTRENIIYKARVKTKGFDRRSPNLG